MPRPPKVPTPPPPGYVWAPEAARRTGRSIKTLRNYRYLGKGPKCVPVGRKLAYPIAELEAWLEADMNPEPDAELERENRPAEVRRASRKKAARSAAPNDGSEQRAA